MTDRILAGLHLPRPLLVEGIRSRAAGRLARRHCRAARWRRGAAGATQRSSLPRELVARRCRGGGGRVARLRGRVARRRGRVARRRAAVTAAHPAPRPSVAGKLSSWSPSAASRCGAPPLRPLSLLAALVGAPAGGWWGGRLRTMTRFHPDCSSCTWSGITAGTENPAQALTRFAFSLFDWHRPRLAVRTVARPAAVATAVRRTASAEQYSTMSDALLWIRSRPRQCVSTNFTTSSFPASSNPSCDDVMRGRHQSSPKRSSIRSGRPCFLVPLPPPHVTPSFPVHPPYPAAATAPPPSPLLGGHSSPGGPAGRRGGGGGRARRAGRRRRRRLRCRQPCRASGRVGGRRGGRRDGCRPLGERRCGRGGGRRWERTPAVAVAVDVVLSAALRLYCDASGWAHGGVLGAGAWKGGWGGARRGAPPKWSSSAAC